MARHQYDVKILRNGREVERVSAQLDVEGDQDTLHAVLRQLLLDAIERTGWKPNKCAHEFTLTARRPGWARDAFPPYVIPRSEVP